MRIQFISKRQSNMKLKDKNTGKFIGVATISGILTFAIAYGLWYMVSGVNWLVFWGIPVTDEFDKETQAFCLAATLKDERLRAGLTQEQLAERIGTKKTYISRLENGKADVQLSTLFRIFEGLGRRVSLTIL